MEWSEEDRAYRAIGRYVVKFSQLIAFMRFTMAYRIHKPEDTVALVDLAFAEATASQITNAFFAVCEEAAGLDDDEKKIGRGLRALVLKQLERRNDVAHGDWHVFSDSTSLLKIKPAKGTQDAWGVADVSSEDLDKWSDWLQELTWMVMDYGHVALGMDTERSIEDLFTMEKKQVVWLPGRQSSSDSSSVSQ